MDLDAEMIKLKRGLAEAHEAIGALGGGKPQPQPEQSESAEPDLRTLFKDFVKRFDAFADRITDLEDAVEKISQHPALAIPPIDAPSAPDMFEPKSDPSGNRIQPKR